MTLRRIHEDGHETTEDIDVPVGRDLLTLLTDEWTFEGNPLDAACTAPDGPADNTARGPGHDVMGRELKAPPELPPPGQEPDDPAEAATEALESLRLVYDLTDPYSETKTDFVENPEEWETMRQRIEEANVLAPYLRRLDPEFDSVAFLSPTEAHVLYRVGPSYQWEIGRVLLIDGVWRVAAGTICRDLSAAGFTCRDVIEDPPPGPLG